MSKHIPEDLDKMSKKELVEIVKIQIEEYKNLLESLETIAVQNQILGGIDYADWCGHSCENVSAWKNQTFSKEVLMYSILISSGYTVNEALFYLENILTRKGCQEYDDFGIEVEDDFSNITELSF